MSAIPAFLNAKCQLDLLKLTSFETAGAYLNFFRFAVDQYSCILKVWFPDFLGLMLREANIITKLFSLTGKITDVRNLV